MDITDQYQYLQEYNNIQFFSEYLKSFKEILKNINEYDKSFQDNKIKMIQDIINMLNYINVETIIKSISIGLIGGISQYIYSNDIETYKSLLSEIEIRSGILHSDLNIETYFKRDERIGYHMLKMKEINNHTKHILYNITKMFEIYERIIKVYDNLKFYGNIEDSKLKINNIKSLIENIETIEKQVLNSKTNLDCYKYYSNRRNQTIEIWKLLQDEFFEISYRPDMFKKIVLDEKEVYLFAN